MNGLHEIRLAGGDQDIVHVPTLRADASPVPTYTIEDLTVSDDSADRVIASGSATLDSTALLLEQESGRGTTSSRRIYATSPSTAGIVAGRRYIVEDVSGKAEVFTLDGWEDYYLDATAPLDGTYQPDSYVRGVELRCTFPELAAAREELLQDDRRLRVTWTYGLRGAVVSVHELAVLVRAPGSGRYVGDAEAMIREEWPELVKALRGANGLRALIRACSRRVEVMLRARKFQPDRFMAGAQGFELLIARCVWRFGELGVVPQGADVTSWTEDARKDFLSLWRAVSGGEAGTGTADVSRDDTAPTGNARTRRRLTVPT